MKEYPRYGSMINRRIPIQTNQFIFWDAIAIGILVSFYAVVASAIIIFAATGARTP